MRSSGWMVGKLKIYKGEFKMQEFEWAEGNFFSVDNDMNQDDYDPDFEDEESEFINKNDPFYRGKEDYSYGYDFISTVGLVGAAIDTELKIKRNNRLKMKVMDTERSLNEEDNDKGIGYVSVKDYVKGKRKVKKQKPLFEQWVDDVISGKKTYDDPL